MADFLLEIGLEEVPARMIASRRAELGRACAGTADAGAAAGRWRGIKTSSTPRRLAVMAVGHACHQPDVEEQLTGPASKVAYKDGQPTPAAHAFAKKAGVDVSSELEKVTTPKASI